MMNRYFLDDSLTQDMIVRPWAYHWRLRIAGLNARGKVIVVRYRRLK